MADYIRCFLSMYLIVGIGFAILADYLSDRKPYRDKFIQQLHRQTDMAGAALMILSWPVLLWYFVEALLERYNGR